MRQFLRVSPSKVATRILLYCTKNIRNYIIILVVAISTEQRLTDKNICLRFHTTQYQNNLQSSVINQ